MTDDPDVAIVMKVLDAITEGDRWCRCSCWMIDGDKHLHCAYGLLLSEIADGDLERMFDHQVAARAEKILERMGMSANMLMGQNDCLPDRDAVRIYFDRGIQRMLTVDQGHMN